MLTDERLAEIEARVNAASPGPWNNHCSPTITGPSMTIYDEGGHSHEDAEFIVGARQDIPDLVAEVRRLRNIMANPLGDTQIVIAKTFTGDVGLNVSIDQDGVIQLATFNFGEPGSVNPTLLVKCEHDGCTLDAAGVFEDGKTDELKRMCRPHGEEIADKGGPQFFGTCPQCCCVFGVG